MEVDKLTNFDQIICLLYLHPKGLNTNEISRNIFATHTALYRALRKLEACGIVMHYNKNADRPKQTKHCESKKPINTYKLIDRESEYVRTLVTVVETPVAAEA